MHLSITSLGFNRPRFSVYFVLAVVVFSTQPAFASADDSTAIVVVGTVHTKTDNFTVQGLTDILERIKPDLILVELDSSFLTPSMSIKPEFLRISDRKSVV
jgi:hypothetical protein